MTKQIQLVYDINVIINNTHKAVANINSVVYSFQS